MAAVPEIEMVTIPKRKYERILRDSRFLAALESGGVDNWDWYGEAIQEFKEAWPQYKDEWDDE